MLVVTIGALLVFGGYLIWTGMLNFLESGGDITAGATADARDAALATTPAPTSGIPTRPPTYTPLPPCQLFAISVERAKLRECPSMDDNQCPFREIVEYGTELCVYTQARENMEWYVVDLNPDGAFRDIVFVHESVVEAANPTPTPSQTMTPLPTISPTPSYTPGPPGPASSTPGTPPPDGDNNPPAGPTPTLTPSATPSDITI